MKYLLIILGFLVSISGIASANQIQRDGYVGKVSSNVQLAQFNGCKAGFCNPSTTGVTPPLSCAESIAFVSRALVAFPTFDTAHQGWVSSLICGLVNTASTISGTLWSRTSALYATATQDASVARLNLKSSSFTLGPIATPSYTTDRCWVLNGTTQYLTTGFVPSVVADGIYTVNSARVDGIVTNLATPSPSSGVILGTVNFSASLAHIRPYTLATGNATGPVNQVSASVYASVASSNVKGRYVSNRITSSDSQIYKDKVPGSVNVLIADFLPTVQFFIGARNNGGTPESFSNDCISAVGWGNQLSATDITAYDTLWVAYLTAVGALP